ncbi:YwhD family protein [Staphylococcus pettenkoferi]|uniref:YwhD family protein n=1 Tax=Staphylococcus pettenkoferi TaxID=170573 RepID=UPI002275ECDF|nr:YwhD family protein [Staphylococcus pettenkoferi]MCY1589118.1 YwhD family protein [Staphylococcus pettenkoferi]MCY1601830.1 YwhD family protein [Staphylococcus pettenkoferi]MCY1607830.1 YwhD family protein [Staphylococcus pettenkoferi]MCY1612694.1 YwhD family protein [Staphylococcus pettenkoferi]MCY1623105.1 YwhD family protein [Staphylococcus pettenkoferi]
MANKKGFKFNIIKNDPLDGHKGTNIGSISLDNVAPVFIDVLNKEAFIDIGGMHARAEVEKGVKWINDKETVEGDEAKPYWLCWVTTERSEQGPYYAGLTACYLLVNKSIRRGYKSMPEHVNMMDKSMKHHIVIDQIGEENKTILKALLQEHNPEMWANSKDELHQAFD